MSNGGNQNQDKGRGQSGQSSQSAVDSIAPFTVECGDDRNRGMISFDALRLRLRGRWDKSKFYRANGARQIGELMSKMPDTPGIRLTVTRRSMTLRIFDPLEEDKALLDKVQKAMDDVHAVKQSGRKIGAWPEAVHKLDEHQLKSVLLEISRKVHAPVDQACMFAVMGSTVPTLAQLENYPGRELYDPWSNSVDKPMFTDQLAEWSDRWERMILSRAAMATAPQ